MAWICGLEHVREPIPFPRMLYRLRAAGGTATEIIPSELRSDRWSRDLVSVPWAAMRQEGRVPA